MTYKLLDDHTGVVLSRQPCVIEEKEVVLSFEGAPDGATAVVTTEEDISFYRQLKGGACTFPVAKLRGVLAVAVTLAEKGKGTRRYVCEGLVATPLERGVLLAPNDMNLPLEVARLRVDNCALRAKNAEIEKKVDALAERLEQMLEGYDLV